MQRGQGEKNKKKKKTQNVIKGRQNGKGGQIDYYKIRQLKLIDVYIKNHYE